MVLIRKFTILLGAVCLIAMTALTCAEVFMRYVFNRPIFGSSEMAQMLLGILVFAGMFAVTRDRGHVNVSLFEPFLMRHFRRGYRSLFDVSTLAGVTGLAGLLVWKAVDLLHYPETTVVLRLPMLWVVGGMAALAALAILAALATMREDKRPTPPHSPQSLD
jgi:TRAP-type C4-dicarboxylate transport system permease small subunit